MNTSLWMALLGFGGVIGGVFAIMIGVGSRLGPTHNGGRELGSLSDLNLSQSSEPPSSGHSGGDHNHP